MGVGVGWFLFACLKYLACCLQLLNQLDNSVLCRFNHNLLVFKCKNLGINRAQKGPPPGFIIQFRKRVLEGEGKETEVRPRQATAFQLLIFPFDRNFYRSEYKWAQIKG